MSDSGGQRVERVRALWTISGATDAARSMRPSPTDSLERLREPPGVLSKLLVGERAGRLYVFEPGKIEYIESHGNYVKYHAESVEYISRDSIKRLAETLTGSGFLRIERSLLINVRSIVYAQRAGCGTFQFTLASGACLRSGPTFRGEILRVLPLARASSAASG
jgi:DNA-binding LytR/AlgR family response regulator